MLSVEMGQGIGGRRFRVPFGLFGNKQWLSENEQRFGRKMFEQTRHWIAVPSSSLRLLQRLLENSQLARRRNGYRGNFFVRDLRDRIKVADRFQIVAKEFET